MLNKIDLAIYKTLIYADFFHFPLKPEEISQYLIWEEKDNPPSLLEIKNKLNALNIKELEGYYYLSDHQPVSQRIEKSSISLKKIHHAENASLILKKIPTIKLIAISGNVAIENASEKDDIDLFIVTQKNTLWFTRFLATLLLDLKKARRKPKSKEYKDKICLNLFLDEEFLTLPGNKQNLYTAHEIAQLKPLLEKDYTYEKFLLANSWVKNFLPNSFALLNQKPHKNKINHITINPFSHLLNFVFTVLNYLMMLPQLFYMKSHRTKEIVNNKAIYFHPHDISVKILINYQNQIDRLI